MFKRLVLLDEAENLGIMLVECVVTLVNCCREEEGSQLARWLIEFYALHNLELNFFMLVLSKEILKGTGTCLWATIENQLTCGF